MDAHFFIVCTLPDGLALWPVVVPGYDVTRLSRNALVTADPGLSAMAASTIVCASSSTRHK